MREKTVCFTGHRNIPLLKKHKIEKKLKETLESLIEKDIAFLVQAVLLDLTQWLPKPF